MNHTLIATLQLENVVHPVLWLAGTLAGAAFLYYTYRGIFLRSDGRRFAWTLMTLRGIGLLALLLALAKPSWTRQSELIDSGRLAFVVDNSLSMSLAESSGKSRYARSREVYDRVSAQLTSAGGAPLIVELYDIQGNKLENGFPEQPTAERTDLATALRKTAEKLRAKPVAGLILISDGMDNTGRTRWDDLSDLPMPVHTVGFQATAGDAGLDLALTRVKAPERAMLNNDIKIDVVVRKTGGPATEATVAIKRGSEELVSKKIDFAAGNAEQTVTLTMKPDKPGSFVLTATVAAAVGEKNLLNNSALFPLRVDKEPIRVLYVEGFLRYEFKYLKAHLQDDPDVKLLTLVRQLNPERGGGAKELVSPESLKNLDVVILGDMEANYLTAAEYEAIDKWLDEKNHSLLVLGGYQSFGPNGFKTTALAEALPVVFADKEPYQSDEPFVMQITEEGKKSPIFDLGGDRSRDAEAWAAAPPLRGTNLVQRAKAAAQVLAVDPKQMVDGKPAVVIATQRYRAGLTMVLTADTTWLWSRLPRVHGQPDTLYSRFWSQTIRWLAGRRLDDQRPLLALTTDRPDYDVGKPVHVNVLRQPRPGVDLSTSEVAAEVLTPAGKIIPVPVKASTAAPDLFTGEYYPSDGGRHEVHATLTEHNNQSANQATEFLVHGSDLELADQGTNTQTLQAIATATGGTFALADNAEQIAPKITRTERRSVRIQKDLLVNTLWGALNLIDFGLFAVFIVAVTAEWLLRRRYHLV